MSAALSAALGATYARLAVLGAPPEVHDVEYEYARAEVARANRLGERELNRIDSRSERSLVRGCRRALAFAAAARERLGQAVAHEQFREDYPPSDFEHMLVDGPRRATRGLERAFFETCVSRTRVVSPKPAPGAEEAGRRAQEVIDALWRKLHPGGEQPKRRPRLRLVRREDDDGED